MAFPDEPTANIEEPVVNPNTPNGNIQNVKRKSPLRILIGVFVLIILLFVLIYKLDLVNLGRTPLSQNPVPESTPSLVTEKPSFLPKEKGPCVIAPEEEYKNQTKLNITGTKTITDPVDQKKLYILYYLRRTNDISSLNINIGEPIVRTALTFSPKADRVGLILETASKSLVYLYDPEKNSSEKVMELKKDPAAENDQLINYLADISFSPDGNTLFISGTEGVDVYDLKEKKMEKLFSNPNPIRDTMGFSTFFNPLLSADGNKLIIGKGYYEGGSDVVYDLVNKKFIDFGYHSYVGGNRILGWFGNKIVVENALSNPDKSGFFLVDPENPTKTETLIGIPHNTFFNTILVGTDLYYSVVNEVNSDKYVCNNDGSKSLVSSQMETIYRYNIENKTREELFTLDNTRRWGVSDPNYDFGTVDELSIEGKKVPLVSIAKNNDYPNPLIYILSDKAPFTLTALK